jgi:hypothetical protein
MGGKYEVRYYTPNGLNEFETEYINSWIRFIWLRISKKLIYYKVYVD